MSAWHATALSWPRIYGNSADGRQQTASPLDICHLIKTKQAIILICPKREITQPSLRRNSIRFFWLLKKYVPSEDNVDQFSLAFKDIFYFVASSKKI